jgi:SpoVK/Ycf46/Vps4 family AAA+-type ATPase
MKRSTLELIEIIYMASENSKLNEPLWETVEEELNTFTKFCKLTKIQALLFANAVIIGYKDSNFKEVFNHLGMESHNIIRYKKDISILYERKLIKGERRNSFDLKNDFEISNWVLESISENKPLVKQKLEKRNLIDLLEEFDQLSEDFDNKVVQFDTFFIGIQNAIQELSVKKGFQKLNLLGLNNFEAYFFLDTLWDAIRTGDNDYNTYIERTVKDYFQRLTMQIQQINFIISKKSMLSKLGLIEISKSNFRQNAYARLSDKLEKILAEHENIELAHEKDKKSNLLESKELPKKKLFYNPSEEEIKLIQNLIQEKSYQKLQSQLKQKSMPTGITVLLYGSPGTGKTESVYQIAKATKRNIIKVDISATKSMWYGESEKLIKAIFSNYEEIARGETLKPILLFNEADAVINKRKSNHQSNTSNTENAIQNILLEELEKFNGILFATTNLHENLDTAFERRFLFKIKFSKPQIENSAKIWKSKIEILTDEEAVKLAENFEFSGAEIENIARKMMMEELIYSKKINFQEIQSICQKEKWQDQPTSKVGYK